MLLDRSSDHVPEELYHSAFGYFAHSSICVLEIHDELVGVSLEGEAFTLVHLVSRVLDLIAFHTFLNTTNLDNPLHR